MLCEVPDHFDYLEALLFTEIGLCTLNFIQYTFLGGLLGPGWTPSLALIHNKPSGLDLSREAGAGTETHALIFQVLSFCTPQDSVFREQDGNWT